MGSVSWTLPRLCLTRPSGVVERGDDTGGVVEEGVAVGDIVGTAVSTMVGTGDGVIDGTAVIVDVTSGVMANFSGWQLVNQKGANNRQKQTVHFMVALLKGHM